MAKYDPNSLEEGKVKTVVAGVVALLLVVLLANGGIVGIDMEILTVAANRLGVRLRPKVFSWGGMVDCVNAKRCEIANGGIYMAGCEFPTVDASEKYADEKMCILREGILSDGRVDEIEAQMLLRLTEPFERFGDDKMHRIVSALRQMLSDGVISESESRQIAVILGGV